MRTPIINPLLSFSDAFAESRKMEVKQFSWRGGVYTTQTKEEVEAQRITPVIVVGWIETP